MLKDDLEGAEYVVSKTNWPDSNILSEELYFCRRIDERFFYHRLDGPAFIQYNRKGEIFSMSYHIEGSEMIDEIKYWNHPLVLQNKLNKILEL